MDRIIETHTGSKSGKELVHEAPFCSLSVVYVIKGMGFVNKKAVLIKKGQPCK